MPLKIGVAGNKSSVKTTLALRLSEKYGVILINPVNIINEAFELNKEVV